MVAAGLPAFRVEAFEEESEMYLGPGRARHKEAVLSVLVWVLAGRLLMGIKCEMDRVFTKGENGWVQTQLINRGCHGRLHWLCRNPQLILGTVLYSEEVSSQLCSLLGP